MLACPAAGGIVRPRRHAFAAHGVEGHVARWQMEALLVGKAGFVGGLLVPLGPDLFLRCQRPQGDVLLDDAGDHRCGKRVAGELVKELDHLLLSKR